MIQPSWRSRRPDGDGEASAWAAQPQGCGAPATRRASRTTVCANSLLFRASRPDRLGGAAVGKEARETRRSHDRLRQQHPVAFAAAAVADELFVRRWQDAERDYGSVLGQFERRPVKIRVHVNEIHAYVDRLRADATTGRPPRIRRCHWLPPISNAACTEIRARGRLPRTMTCTDVSMRGAVDCRHRPGRRCPPSMPRPAQWS
jgi:hypothetical protein